MGAATRLAGDDPVTVGTGRTGIVQAVTLSETGGAQKVVLSLLKAAAGSGEPLHLVCGPGGDLVSWVRRDLPAVAIHELPSIRVAPSPRSDLVALVQLVRLLRRMRPRVLHVHSSKMALLGRIAARLTGVPLVVYTVHGWAAREYHSPLAQRLYTWLERLGSRLCDHIVCVAEHELEKALRLRLAPPEKLRVIYNGVAPPPPERGRLRTELFLSDECPLVVGAGRLAKPKDPLSFIRMAAVVGKRFPRARFVWLGDGPLMAECQRELRKQGLGGRLWFLGNRADARALLNDADLFVLPSHAEALPLVILEAMWAGKPVVATRVGGVSELVDPGVNGLLVAPGDPNALAAAVEEVLTDMERWREAGKAGRRKAEEFFREEVMQRQYLRLYGL